MASVTVLISRNSGGSSKRRCHARSTIWSQAALRADAAY
jgi:hypothetical protein